MEPIQLLVTLDGRYLPQLVVLLTSLAVNDPSVPVELYLMHRALSPEELDRAGQMCARFGWKLHPVQVDKSLFAAAPVTRQYPQEMYYRLLAPHLLPQHVERVLYLDPDILVINPLRPLWEMDLKGRLFAAAAHTGTTELANSVNRVRLGTDHDYYNSGVLLMDLAAGRRRIVPGEVFAYVAEHGKELLLPDQDLLNALYGDDVLPLEDVVWNYDARNYNTYLLRSGRVCDLDWVMAHTAVLHFCGKSKPWKKGYVHRFGVLYKHYMRLAARI